MELQLDELEKLCVWHKRSEERVDKNVLIWPLFAALSPAMTSVVSMVAITRKAAKRSKANQEKLRAELRAANMDNAVKQKIIKNLYEQIERVTVQLEVEKSKQRRNAEVISQLEEQIEDILNTIAVARAA